SPSQTTTRTTTTTTTTTTRTRNTAHPNRTEAKRNDKKPRKPPATQHQRDGPTNQPASQPTIPVKEAYRTLPILPWEKGHAVLCCVHSREGKRMRMGIWNGRER
uniref:Uncharacterized protein n=1 Tax=Anopheles minimus TaxID=112268 RepID=A0A182VVZ9_9DIPT